MLFCNVNINISPFNLLRNWRNFCLYKHNIKNGNKNPQEKKEVGENKLLINKILGSIIIINKGK